MEGWITNSSEMIDKPTSGGGSLRASVWRSLSRYTGPDTDRGRLPILAGSQSTAAPQARVRGARAALRGAGLIPDFFVRKKVKFDFNVICM